MTFDRRHRGGSDRGIRILQQGTRTVARQHRSLLRSYRPVSTSRSVGRPRHPKDVEACDCIDFYDAANARPYGWEIRRRKEVILLRVKGRLLVSDSAPLIGAC